MTGKIEFPLKIQIVNICMILFNFYTFILRIDSKRRVDIILDVTLKAREETSL